MDALLDTLIWTLALVVPCAVLTAAGVVLWKRWRSVATALIALGFAATLLSVVSALLATHKTHAVMSELASAPQSNQDTLFIVAHYRRFPLLGILGMWVAAAGTLWHVRQQR